MGGVPVRYEYKPIVAREAATSEDEAALHTGRSARRGSRHAEANAEREARIGAERSDAHHNDAGEKV